MKEHAETTEDCGGTLDCPQPVVLEGDSRQLHKCRVTPTLHKTQRGRVFSSGRRGGRRPEPTVPPSVSVDDSRDEGRRRRLMRRERRLLFTFHGHARAHQKQVKTEDGSAAAGARARARGMWLLKLISPKMQLAVVQSSSSRPPLTQTGCERLPSAGNRSKEWIS